MTVVTTMVVTTVMTNRMVWAQVVAQIWRPPQKERQQLCLWTKATHTNTMDATVEDAGANAGTGGGGTTIRRSMAMASAGQESHMAGVSKGASTTTSASTLGARAPATTTITSKPTAMAGPLVNHDYIL